MTMRTLLALLLLLSLTIGIANAEWPNDALTYKGYRKDLYWSHYFCGGKYRPEGCENYRWRQWRYRYVAPSDTGSHCHSIVAATGSQAQSIPKAQERALIAWMADVSYRYGTRYMDITHAKGRLIDCSISDVGDTLGGKVQDVFGVGHYRCRLTAQPCRVEAKKWKDN